MKVKQFLKRKTLRAGSLLAIFVVATAGAGIWGCSSEKKPEAATAQKAEATQLWTCGMHPQVIQDKPGNCPICGMKLTPVKAEAATTTGAHEHDAGMTMGETRAAEAKPTGEMAMASTSPADTPSKTKSKKEKKILYWRAPMDPTYISDKPGKSPMGMDLIPVYEGEEPTSGGSTITIDPNVVQNIGVRTAPVEVKKLHREIRTVGHVDYDEETMYRINTKFSGWIEKLYVDETGQRVYKGQPMLDIYSPELVATQEEYLLAYKNAQKLRNSQFAEVAQSGDDLLQAVRQRLLLWDISEAQIRELETTGQVRKTMTLYAPHDCIVIHKNAEEGMYAKAGMDLFRVADLTKVWVYAHLFEYEIPWVHVGDEVEMESPYIPGIVYKGRVKYIYPYLDKKTRDVKVRLEVPNPDLRLKPQMYVNVRFLDEMKQPTPVVPSEAVIRTGRRNIVFIALGNGRFEPREIVLGAEGENEEFQVLAGLKGGEQIVTSAQFLLDSESRIQEAIQKMLKQRLQKKNK